MKYLFVNLFRCIIRVFFDNCDIQDNVHFVILQEISPHDEECLRDDSESTVILYNWRPWFLNKAHGTASDPVSMSSSQSTLILSDASTVAFSDTLPDLD